MEREFAFTSPGNAWLACCRPPSGTPPPFRHARRTSQAPECPLLGNLGKFESKGALAPHPLGMDQGLGGVWKCLSDGSNTFTAQRQWPLGGLAGAPTRGARMTRDVTPDPTEWAPHIPQTPQAKAQPTQPPCGPCRDILKKSGPHGQVMTPERG